MTTWVYLSIDERRVKEKHFRVTSDTRRRMIGPHYRGRDAESTAGGLLITGSSVSFASQNFILQVTSVTTAWSGPRAPARRLGVLFAGLGSISTTLIAGVQAIKRGLGRPVGSLALLGSLDTGTAQSPKLSYYRDCLDMVSLDNLVFGGWDIVQTDGYAAARRAAVLQPELLDQLQPELSAIQPWPGIFDSRFNRRSDIFYYKKGRDFVELADQVKSDIL